MIIYTERNRTMLYSEFISGTGCKDNEHNYQIYKGIEILYMTTNMSKEEAYKYGRKLVDNSKSEKQLKIEAEINEEIDTLKEEIKSNNYWISYHEAMAMLYKGDDNEAYKAQRRTMKNLKESNKALRNRIKSLKWVLEA